MNQDLFHDFILTAVLFGVVYGTAVARAGLPMKPKRGTKGGKKAKYHVPTSQTFSGDACNMAAQGKGGGMGFVWLAWVGIPDPMTPAGNVRSVHGHMVPVIGGLDRQPGKYGTNTPKRGAFAL